MRPEDTKLIDDLIDAIASQDLDRLLELTAPDVEWQSVFAQLREGGIYRGHDGIRQYMADLAETAEALQSVIDGALRIGDTVLAVGRLTYRGKGSGAVIETPVGYFMRTRERRVLQMRVFREPEEALAALGPPSLR